MWNHSRIILYRRNLSIYAKSLLFIVGGSSLILLVIWISSNSVSFRTYWVIFFLKDFLCCTSFLLVNSINSLGIFVWNIHNFSSVYYLHLLLLNQIDKHMPFLITNKAISSRVSPNPSSHSLFKSNIIVHVCIIFLWLIVLIIVSDCRWFDHHTVLLDLVLNLHLFWIYLIYFFYEYLMLILII